MSSLKFFLIFIFYSLLFTAFTIYSYTQVDLNLTLSSNSAYQSIQRQLTGIGYFNRPLSTVIFFLLVLSCTFLYFLVLKLRRNFTAKQLWTLLFVKYGQNPYFTTPLNFLNDDWTRFMRWTHVGSVYPPGWLITTIPFYLLGFGKFTLTLLSFKFLGLISFLGSSWLMLKIAGRRAWILWSFNPMVLIESLSSVHNEISMVFFTLLGFYFMRQGKSFKDFPLRILPLVWGGLIKYASFLLLPFLNRPVLAAIAAWIGAIAFFFAREINPWYILLPVAISFMSKNKYLVSLSFVSSLLIIYRYYPCVAIFSC